MNRVVEKAASHVLPVAAGDTAPAAGRGFATKGGWHRFLFVAACVLAASTAFGNLEKDVEWVRPRIAQRGTTVEVVIQGMYLAEPQELVFYKPGIRAKKLEPLPKLKHPIGLGHGGRIEEQVKAVLEIAPDCEPGEHPFRLRTTRGLSLLSTFHVSPFPVIPEAATPHATIATAQLVSPNVTVLGTVDHDVYSVPAAPGSRLSVEVDCVRLADIHYGDAEFDLMVRVLDQTGRVLATNDENALHVQDPLVSLRLPDDLPGGHAYVEVRQSNHQPRAIPYCVHIGNFRRPLAAYPAGGPAGETLSTTFLGDPLGEFAETVSVPNSPGTFSWFGEAPSPLALRACPYGNVLEEPDAAETRVPTLPIALNGVIEAPGDTDAFRVSAKKGDRYRVRVYASALGHPIDPAIRIRPVVDGKPGPVEVEADDADPRTLNDRDLFGTSIRSGGGIKDVLDPSVIWEPRADGEYVIDISDNAGGGGPTAVYRIEIDTPPQAVHFVLRSTFNDWVEGSRGTGLAVPQGGRWTVTLDLHRGQGTTDTGPFDIVANGLPEGVRLVSPRVPASTSRWPVQLVADAAAKPGAKIITFAAKSADPAVVLASSVQQAVPFVSHSGGDAWRVLRVDRAAMAVTDPAPIAIDLVPPTAALVRGGELFIPVKLTRQPGYDDPVEWQADFAPQGVGLPPKDVISSGAAEAVLQITADAKAPLGKGPLYVMATTLGGSDYLGPGRIRVSSEIIEIEVTEPFMELASEPVSVRRGGQATVSFKATPKSGFEGEAEANLLGLPKGVAIVGPKPRITKDAKEIAFTVEATDDALLGAVTGLECELVVKSGGQEVRQRSGKGTLRIDPRL
jgi:hypothetical protein